MLVAMIVKVSSLSVREWKDVLGRILGRLGYVLVSKLENGDEVILIADSSGGNWVKTRIQKICDIRLGTILLPKVKVEIFGLSKEEEKLFNEIFMRCRGGC